MKQRRSSLILWSLLVGSAAALANCAGELEDEAAFEEVKANVNPAIRNPSNTAGTPSATTPPASSSALSATAAASTTGPQPTASASAAVPSASTASSAPMPGGSAVLPENCDALALLGASCSGCHQPNGVGPSDLRASIGIDGMLDVVAQAGGACDGKKLVDSSAPQESLLITKLQTVPSCGQPMRSLALVSLSDADVKCITDWTIAVANGAR
jgi:hypothetical protein